MALILNGSDTSAGDDAGLGYTSAEGIIITGQGSTSDVTIKNDADATVLSIPTGTTKVGIGTTAAAVNLHVASGADGVAARFSRTSGGGVVDVENYNGIGGIGTSDNIPFRFNTNNTERVRILNDGKVGIGTSAPTRTLTVIGSVGNQFVGSQSQSDDTAKYGTYAGSHYHNSEQDVAGVVVLSNGSDNIVYLGGGVSELNAATVLAFILVLTMQQQAAQNVCGLLQMAR